MPRGRHHRIAILWLRLIAVLMILYAVVDVAFAALYYGGTDGTWRQILHAATWYGIGGVLLWLLSPGVGKFVAMGLDDPPVDPPDV